MIVVAVTAAVGSVGPKTILKIVLLSVIIVVIVVIKSVRLKIVRKRI